MGTTYDEGRCDWLDFEPEPDTTGDGAGDRDKYILTIRDESGEELAVIVHRTCDGTYPLDGELANQKRHNAQVICDALNANHQGETHAERLWEAQRLDTSDPDVTDVLDQLVHDVADELASVVNNTGGEEQVAFLLGNGWTMQQIVERVAASVTT